MLVIEVELNELVMLFSCEFSLIISSLIDKDSENALAARVVTLSGSLMLATPV